MHRPLVYWLLWICLTGTLLASALGKSLDLAGFVDVLVTYRAFPDWALWPVALVITGIEWLLGFWMLSHGRLAVVALVALSINVIYAVWQAVALLRGLDLPNCGCFGVFFPQPLRWYSPFEDLVLAGMCYALHVLARERTGSH